MYEGFQECDHMADYLSDVTCSPRGWTLNVHHGDIIVNSTWAL